MKNLFQCKDCVDLLLDYVEQTLDADMRRRLDEHLSDCPPCLHFLKTYRKCSEFAEKLKDQRVQIPTEMENRLKSFLKQELCR
jgi:anti-sigma factor RsiW